MPFCENHYEMTQDNARPHLAKKTTAWLEANVPYVMSHPAYSPALNPIEHEWSMIKYELEKREPGNFNELRVTIEEIWEGLPQSKIQHCITILRSRLN